MRYLLKWSLAATLAVSLISPISATPKADTESQFINVIKQARADNDRLLFAISSKGSTVNQLKTKLFEPKKFEVTLTGVSSHATYLNQPPHAKTGVVPVADIAKNWVLLSHAIAGLQPNIAFVAADPGGGQNLTQVLSIRNPKYDQKAGTFTFSGEQPATIGSTSLRSGSYGPTTIFLG